MNKSKIRGVMILPGSNKPEGLYCPAGLTLQ